MGLVDQWLEGREASFRVGMLTDIGAAMKISKHLRQKCNVDQIQQKDLKAYIPFDVSSRLLEQAQEKSSTEPSRVAFAAGTLPADDLPLARDAPGKDTPATYASGLVVHPGADREREWWIVREMTRST
jgi:hypothetical protein